MDVNSCRTRIKCSNTGLILHPFNPCFHVFILETARTCFSILATLNAGEEEIENSWVHESIQMK